MDLTELGNEFTDFKERHDGILDSQNAKIEQLETILARESVSFGGIPLETVNTVD